MPYFITISNNRTRDDKVVAMGNERVLRARLEDAMFFFQEDLKIPLKTRVEELNHKEVTFLNKFESEWRANVHEKKGSKKQSQFHWQLG